MKVLLPLLRKEFRQIFRNPSILRLILIIPVVQLLILPLAADFEFKNILIAIVDHDHSDMSRELKTKILASGYFRLVMETENFQEAYHRMELDKADVVLEIPQDFESDMIREKNQSLFLAVNAINGTKASVGGAYLGRIVGEFNRTLRLRLLTGDDQRNASVIEVNPQNWFNRFLIYTYFMVPGILVVLVTMIGGYMCALNIVKEKEVGTIEQINVTPIRKYHFILGKLIPFWIIGVFVFSIGLFLIARLVYGIVPVGSIPLLYAFLALYLVTVLGIGLLISTYSATQQQAMSLAFFFMMIFLLMSGLFTPVESMPEWGRWIARLNPVTYFIEVMRMVVLKGSGFRHIQQHFLVMAGFALFFNTWAVLNYRKTS